MNSFGEGMGSKMEGFWKRKRVSLRMNGFEKGKGFGEGIVSEGGRDELREKGRV